MIFVSSPLILSSWRYYILRNSRASLRLSQENFLLVPLELSRLISALLLAAVEQDEEGLKVEVARLQVSSPRVMFYVYPGLFVHAVFSQL